MPGERAHRRGRGRGSRTRRTRGRGLHRTGTPHVAPCQSAAHDWTIRAGIPSGPVAPCERNKRSSCPSPRKSTTTRRRLAVQLTPPIRSPHPVNRPGQTPIRSRQKLAHMLRPRQRLVQHARPAHPVEIPAHHPVVRPVGTPNRIRQDRPLENQEKTQRPRQPACLQAPPHPFPLSFAWWSWSCEKT